jgi:hypothetical protein
LLPRWKKMLVNNFLDPWCTYSSLGPWHWNLPIETWYKLGDIVASAYNQKIRAEKRRNKEISFMVVTQPWLNIDGLKPVWFKSLNRLQDGVRKNCGSKRQLENTLPLRSWRRKYLLMMPTLQVPHSVCCLIKNEVDSVCRCTNAAHSFTET